MTNQLIPVFNGTISNESALLVNARDLHEFLGVGKRFASWITERIAEYGFVKNQDFIIISQIREKIGRGRPARDYHLTLDTAKELAMVERNEKGRQIRRYFIECEKQLMKARQPKPQSEVISSDHMAKLKNLVWCAAHNMHFKEAWTQGIWYSLRAAAGRPSPQSFTVDDLPVMAEELRRILKITAAVHSANYDFEKEVIRIVLRRRGDIEPVLGMMESRLEELKQNEAAGRLTVDKIYGQRLNSLSVSG